jgi:hypothetical protein
MTDEPTDAQLADMGFTREEWERFEKIQAEAAEHGLCPRCLRKGKRVKALHSSFTSRVMDAHCAVYACKKHFKLLRRMECNMYLLLQLFRIKQKKEGIK